MAMCLGRRHSLRCHRDGCFPRPLHAPPCMGDGRGSCSVYTGTHRARNDRATRATHHCGSFLGIRWQISASIAALIRDMINAMSFMISLRRCVQAEGVDRWTRPSHTTLQTHRTASTASAYDTRHVFICYFTWRSTGVHLLFHMTRNGCSCAISHVTRQDVCVLFHMTRDMCSSAISHDTRLLFLCYFTWHTTGVHVLFHTTHNPSLFLPSDHVYSANASLQLWFWKQP